MWILVKSKRELLDDELILRNLKPSYAEFNWTRELIRSEDIRGIYELDENILVLEFYDKPDKMIIQESINDLQDRLIPLDYEISFTLEETPEEEIT